MLVRLLIVSCISNFIFFAGSVAGAGEAEVARIEAVLDDFHRAASDADEERYFGHFAASGVFIGTDATERWSTAEFRAYVHPYFSQGQGWTYHPRDRHVAVSAGGDTAWFDELLDNAKYGECRGTGVLQRLGGEWKIEQYHLTFPIPNELAADFTARIRELADGERRSED